MNKYINKQDGLIHLLAVGLLLVLAIGVGGAWVYQQQTKTPIQLAKTEGKTNVGTYKELEENDIAEIEASAETSNTAAAKIQEPSSPASNTTTASKSVAASETQALSPAGKITISDDGCHVTAEGEPGMTLEVGAIKANKGGSMTYTMPNKGPVTKSTGGFKDMTAYGTLYSTDGTKIIFKSGPITANECPPAG